MAIKPPDGKTEYVEREREYAVGSNPAVAAIGNLLLEVHDVGSDGLLHYVLFTVGKLSRLFADRHYGVCGERAALAACPDNKSFVQVHWKSPSGLYWNVGSLDGGIIEWITANSGEPVQYDEGYNPAVIMIDSNAVLEVHDNGDGSLYYNLGQLALSTDATATIEWSSGQQYDHGMNPSVCMTKDNHVLEVHENPKHSQLHYNVGRLDKGSLTWLLKGNAYNVGRSPAITMDPFGTAIGLHADDKSSIVYQYLGTVGKNYIAWHGIDSNMIASGSSPSTAVVPDAGSVVAKFHSKQGKLYYSTMLIGADLVRIAYGDAQPGKAVRFATAETSFDNSLTGSELKQQWTISEVYTCTNEYVWDESTHYGASVTGSVRVFGAGIQSEEEASINLTIGQPAIISRQFTWTMSQRVIVKESGNSVCYVATIYRKPTIVPFTATFKRGDIEWTASGNVHVSHGVIYSNISKDSP